MNAFVALASDAAPFLLAFVAGALSHRLYSTIREILAKPTPLERLKNALLAYALIRHGVVDPMAATNYRAYDGTTLPAFSGFDVTNACFSYIQSDHDRLFAPFPSRAMNDKHDAVVRYMDRNLATLDQVVELFEKQQVDKGGANMPAVEDRATR